MTPQFIRFMITGGVAACINFGSRFLYNTFMGFGSAILAAYATGMTTAFVLAKLFVFEKSQHSTGTELYYFTLVNLAAVVQTYGVSVGLADYLFPQIGFNLYPNAIAHGIGIVIPIFSSFIGHKYLSFKKGGHEI